MTTMLRRYDFGERMADILGESRRDLRVRVTMLVSGGLIPPGPRGRGSPPATPDYAADLLIGLLAAPAQVYTAEAVRCYRDLQPTRRAFGGPVSGIVLGPPPRSAGAVATVDPPLLAGRPAFAAMLTRLLDRARLEDGREALSRDLVGVWVGRGCPVAAIQFAAWADARRTMLTQRYDMSDTAVLPSWLDPEQGGTADPGLFHTVFLPVRKLIDIGALTSAQDERKPPMIDLGSRLNRLAEFAQLTRETRHRRPWKTFLDKAAESLANVETLESETSRLKDVADFGDNPGNLRMKVFVPKGLPEGAPLVVALHGCTQSAESYDRGTGWSTLAERHGFAVLLPDQLRRNNALRCFNWFKPEDTIRDGGEAASIRHMVERMCFDYGLDRRRVYVTGVSAGGAMAAAMLATYPDVFAGGAPIAGVPYGAATNMQQGFEAIFQGRSLTAGEWGGRVRAASPHSGPWPTLSVWHGREDSTVTPLNAEEMIKQWTNIHGLPETPTVELEVDGGHKRRVWQDAEGRDVIESWTVAGMAHGVPIDPSGPDGCGEAAPFILDVGLSSTWHIAQAWGLTETRLEPPIDVTPETPTDAKTETPAEAGTEVVVSAIAADEDTTKADPAKEEWARRDFKTGRRRAAAGDGADGLAGGLDVHGIIAKSFEAAGLIAGSERRAPSGAPLGIDIPAILATSFEAAGLLRAGRDAMRTGRPTGAEAAKPADLPEVAPGWHLAAGDGALLGEGTVLNGRVVSGIDGKLGEANRRVSCRVKLGDAPTLSYVRRLDLKASANMFTTAAFTVLVDDVPVDEATACGMDYAERAWTDRTEIDLSPFAGRTVALTFELTANANLLIEVMAEAWVREIVLQDAATAESDPIHAPPV